MDRYRIDMGYVDDEGDDGEDCDSSTETQLEYMAIYVLSRDRSMLTSLVKEAAPIIIEIQEEETSLPQTDSLHSRRKGGSIEQSKVGEDLGPKKQSRKKR